VYNDEAQAQIAAGRYWYNVLGYVEGVDDYEDDYFYYPEGDDESDLGSYFYDAHQYGSYLPSSQLSRRVFVQKQLVNPPNPQKPAVEEAILSQYGRRY
jgi:hypothetical protein